MYLGGVLHYALKYNVTLTLDGVTCEAPSSVMWGEPLSLTLTPDAGKQMKQWTVVVMMGETDVTANAYDASNNSISIANVMGDVSITASAVTMTAEYVPIQYVKSVYVANAKNTPFSIPYYPNEKTCMEMDVRVSNFSASTVLFGTMTYNTTPRFFFFIQYGSAGYSQWHYNTSSQNSNTGNYRINSSVWQKVVVEKNKITYTNNGGERTTLTVNSSGTFQTANTRPLNVGGAVYASNGNCYWGGVEIQRVLITEAGDTKFDLVAAKRLSDGLVGLYDTLTGTFYAKTAANWVGPS